VHQHRAFGPERRQRGQAPSGPSDRQMPHGARTWRGDARRRELVVRPEGAVETQQVHTGGERVDGSVHRACRRNIGERSAGARVRKPEAHVERPRGCPRRIARRPARHRNGGALQAEVPPRDVPQGHAVAVRQPARLDARVGGEHAEERPLVAKQGGDAGGRVHRERRRGFAQQNQSDCMVDFGVSEHCGGDRALPQAPGPQRAVGSHLLAQVRRRVEEDPPVAVRTHCHRRLRAADASGPGRKAVAAAAIPLRDAATRRRAEDDYPHNEKGGRVVDPAPLVQ